MLEIRSGLVAGARASCFVKDPVPVLGVLRLEEKQGNEDFLDIRVLSEPECPGMAHVSEVLRKMVEGPLWKTRLVLEFVVIGDGPGVFDSCVNAGSFCFIRGGVPLRDTFASATASGECEVTIVCGLFTDCLVHFWSQGQVQRTVIEKARDRCRRNALAIKDYVLSLLEERGSPSP